MTDRDALLQRIDLAELLDELSSSPRTRLGRSARWRCIDPSHEDQRPSVTMFTDSRGIERWRCWSGGHGGTAIDAILVARGGTIRDAIEDLERRAELPPQADWPRRAPPPRPVADPAGRVSPDLLEYVFACERILWRPQGRTVRDYLIDERGLSSHVLEANHVGADPGPSALRRARGLPRGGIAAVLPTLDVSGRVTYAQARYLNPEGGRSRYDNPAAHVASNPRFGVVRCPHAHESRTLLVCEGTIDGLSAAGFGVRATSMLGATYADESLAARLREIASGATIIIAFDGDDAGRAAAEALSDALGRASLSSKILMPPQNLDVNAMLRKDPDWLVRGMEEPSRSDGGPDGCRVLPDHERARPEQSFANELR